MKINKNSMFYFIVWATLFVLFNVIAFVSVGWAGAEKYTASFWVGYVFITLCFIGQLLCALTALKEDNMQKLFYNVSLIKTSYTGLVLSFIVGGLCMIISPLPYWVGVIACAIILAVNVISVTKTKLAVDTVSEIDKKIKVQTFFIKSLTVDADGLVARAKSDAVKAECKKVYEAVRYSDPMSNDALASVESQITVKFATLADVVAADDAAAAEEIAKELIILVNDRNKKCKLLK